MQTFALQGVQAHRGMSLCTDGDLFPARSLLPRSVSSSAAYLFVMKICEAFPSILRLLLHFDFVQELESQGTELDTWLVAWAHRAPPNLWD